MQAATSHKGLSYSFSSIIWIFKTVAAWCSMFYYLTELEIIAGVFSLNICLIAGSAFKYKLIWNVRTIHISIFDFSLCTWWEYTMTITEFPQHIQSLSFFVSLSFLLIPVLAHLTDFYLVSQLPCMPLSFVS